MPLDKCKNCGSFSISVEEQKYNGYIVPVLKCTTCGTVYGVANQSEEIEMIKNAIIKLEKSTGNAFKTEDEVINRIGTEIREIQAEIKNK